MSGQQNSSIPNIEALRKMTDNKYDPKLGAEIQEHLRKVHLETPSIDKAYAPLAAEHYMELGMREAMKHLGLDMEDPSLKDTPARFACMVVGELTKGLCYDLFPKCTTFPAEAQDMVLVRNIQVMSLCEHHLQTIDGVAHIAYIPNNNLLGLSKFARVVEFFSRRPQVQERLTAQIYYALCHILKTNNVAVVINATHYCMKARGAMQTNSTTQTDKMGGHFFTNAALRQEVMDAIRTA